MQRYVPHIVRRLVAQCITRCVLRGRIRMCVRLRGYARALTRRYSVMVMCMQHRVAQHVRVRTRGILAQRLYPRYHIRIRLVLRILTHGRPVPRR